MKNIMIYLKNKIGERVEVEAEIVEKRPLSYLVRLKDGNIIVRKIRDIVGSRWAGENAK